MAAGKEKLRAGLISTDRNLESQFKESIEQCGGGYVYMAQDHVEMIQKLGVQKIHLLLLDARSPQFGAQAQSFVSFFRSKKDYAKIPIGIYFDDPQFTMKALIVDPHVRAIPSASGLFLGIMNLMPMTQSTNSPEYEPLTTSFIEAEFLTALKSKVGEQVVFTPGAASDDELHSSFLCQVNVEIRSHLAWLKIGARILETEADGFSKMFSGLSADMVESVSESILKGVLEDFQSALELDLHSRGALFFPSMEDLPAQDRKTLFSRSQSQPLVFRSNTITVLLELIRYL